MKDKTAAVVEISSDIARIIDELSKGHFTEEAFSALLAQVQKIVDHLNLENFSNLDPWVDSLNQRIDHILGERLTDAINAWCLEFEGSDERSMVNGDGPVKAHHHHHHQVIEGS